MRSVGPILACLITAALAGCGSGTAPPSATAKGGIPRLVERPRVQNEFHQIYLFYQEYVARKGRPPRNLDELKELMEPSGREYQALRDGKYIFNWNANA